MTLQELKQQIENKNVTDSLIIFKETDEKFISKQYLNAIKNIRGLEFNYFESPDSLLTTSNSLFGDVTDDTPDAINVINCEVFQWDNPNIKDLHNVIIVTNKFANKDIEKLFADYIVSIPKLSDWQIKDYVYSVAEGAEQKELDQLINLCSTNIHRLQSELDKVTLFNDFERKYVFSDMLRDGALADLSSFSIFNLTNAITSKDLKTIYNIYREIDRIDINEFGLLTVLLKNFKNIVMVQLNSNPTPENTGLDSKVLYAIKRLPRVYSAEQLVNIFQFLSDLDRQVKMGELPADIMIEYMILKILSF